MTYADPKVARLEARGGNYVWGHQSSHAKPLVSVHVVAVRWRETMGGRTNVAWGPTGCVGWGGGRMGDGRDSCDEVTGWVKRWCGLLNYEGLEGSRSGGKTRSSNWNILTLRRAQEVAVDHRGPAAGKRGLGSRHRSKVILSLCKVINTRRDSLVQRPEKHLIGDS